MGSSWVAIRDAVRSGTFRAHDTGAHDVVARFDTLLRFAGLMLGQRLGADVQLVLSRKELRDPAIRAEKLLESLAAEGTLSGAIRIRDAAATLHVTSDLRARQIACHCSIDAPRQGRGRTRVNWLVRQLKNAPDDLRIEAFVMHGRGPGAAELLNHVRENPDLLVVDASKELKTFKITKTAPIGTKRGAGRGSFIEPQVPDEPVSLTSTAQSSQDESEASADAHSGNTGGN